MTQQTILRIKNIKTEREYTVSGDDWKAIQAKGWANRYTVIDERTVKVQDKTSFIPEEIQEAARNLSQGTDNQQGRAKRSGGK